MSNYSYSNSGSGRRSDEQSSYRSSGGSRGGSGRGGRFGGNGGGGSRRGFGGGSRRPRREIKKFDPSMFIRKVEEQTVAPTYISKHMFTDFLIEEQLKRNIINRGYKVPTPIQDQVIPLLLEGKDVIASANTGTGKTAGFLIPLINNILNKKISRALIIAPTRELAEQIQTELDIFKAKTGLQSALCIGGASMYYQVRKLERNPEFVIGTPGRLKDLEKQDVLDFGSFNAIVLDEVDTMLDMGFITDVRHIISQLPAKRQSLFFSATVSKKLKMIMESFVHNPVSVNVQTRQSSENVNQDVIAVNSAEKLTTLHDLLIKPEYKKTIIFLRTKRSVDTLSKELRERGFVVSTMHGNKTQAQRKRALLLFKNNAVKVLLATDVVARGIDIDDVSHVINYDMPQTHEDYIHRIGRTGRADKIGQAITFIEKSF